MRLWTRMAAATVGIGVLAAITGCGETGVRRLAANEYRDKMMGGWIGQCVGVGWGAPTEFKATGHILPADKVPAWKPEMVNISSGRMICTWR